MSTPSLAIVLHGARWPATDAGASWRDRVARLTGRSVELILARDEARNPRGAAACIAEALATTHAAQVLVADVFARPGDDLLRALIEATAGAATLAAPRPLVAAEADRPTLWSGDREPPRFDEPPVWALRRDAAFGVESIDTTLWSFGVFEDVAALVARRGGQVVRVDGDVDVSDASYRFVPAVETFLRWRNRLRLATAHASSATLGPTLLPTLLGLLGAAWQATGLDARAIRFGGTWGRASIGRRVRARLGGPAPDDLWPADEAATAIPLAALQAFALELPTLVERRAPEPHREHAAPGRASAASTPDAAARGPRVVTLPRVSVIVVNWNGRSHLDDCFSTLQANDYPRDRVQLICVDNGSTDGSVDLLRDRFPDVHIVALPENRGFTGGNAAGVAEATGDVFVFVNNDMKFEPTFLSRLVSALDGDTACAAARVMSWDGQAIDFVRGTASFEARGFQEHFGERYVTGTALAESFFPNGGAFAVTRAAYDEAGGFDPALFAYYDDVDLGWRLRMAGHAIRTAPEAVAYHRHNATVVTQPHAHKRFLMARNALWAMVRNYDDVTLPHVLPAVLTLAGLRVAQDTAWLGTPLARLLRPWIGTRHRGAPPRPYDDGTASPASMPTRILARIPMPEFAALGAMLEDLPRLTALRAQQQSQRRVADVDVLPFLGRPFQELDGRRTYRAAQKALVEALSLRERLGVRPHVVLITHEALRTRMSGPAIRVLEMARALSRTARVTVMAPAPLEVTDDRVALVPYDPARPSALQAQAESADALVVQGFALTSFPFLTQLVCPIVADLYCPFTIEHLEQARAAGVPIPASIEQEAASILDVQNAQLRQADYFICASERQRDFWIGTLHTAGRVNPRTVARDADLRSLIDVVPFGLPSEAVAEAATRARASRAAQGLPTGVLKGVHPAIRSTDRVLLWGGSLLDWQDPESLIQAVARIARTRDDVKLFFMGVKHPNPLVKPMAVVERSRRLAESLGIADTHVIFNDWVPYEERALYLLEADLGVSTHHDHLETRYAYRTRMLDYLWARLPIVCTEGDYFGDLVAARGLGRAVPPADPEALALAITSLLDDEDARQAARAQLSVVASTMTWEQVVEPLRAWASAPAFAADREGDVAAFRATLANSYRASRWLKRTALQLGVNERTWERIKTWKPVRAAMSIRNAAAIERARRKARRR